jgi:hypothetical protein
MQFIGALRRGCARGYVTYMKGERSHFSALSPHLNTLDHYLHIELAPPALIWQY